MEPCLLPRVTSSAVVMLTIAAVLGSAAPAAGAQAAQAGPPLRLEVFGSERVDAFHVTSTLIAGATESILWDAQYKVTDGKRLAERIAATGTRLKAIVLSHADHDHYMGAMEVLRRFPGTPVYMTATALADFQERSQRDLAQEKSRPNPEAPDSLVSPQRLPSTTLTVDGAEIQVIPDLAGDVHTPASAALWIPVLRTALVADLAFSGVHPWLGDSDIASRAAWRTSLDRIAALGPVAVIPGHKRDPATPDSPDILASMSRYLARFDALMQSATTPQELAQAVQREYPDLAIPALMAAGARRNFKK